MTKKPVVNRRSVVVKIQTVETTPLTIGDGCSTVGQHIDEMLRNGKTAGLIANKIVIDLNPPALPNGMDMGDDLNVPAEEF